MEAKKSSTQTENSRYSHLVVIAILLGAFLRLWNISSHTEFLGDQGSTFVTIYEAWQQKKWLLVGPQMSTGYFPGPAYYYLIAPFLIFFGFQILVGPYIFVFLGLLTSIYLYLGVKSLWGDQAGVIAATFYSVFPFFVLWDQRMWNPTAIPFFLSILFFTVVKGKRQTIQKSLLQGGIVSILFQLHPTTIIVSLPLICFSLWRSTMLTFFVFLLGCIVPLMPLLFYEQYHSYANIRVLLSSILHPNGQISVHYLIGILLLLVIVSSVLFQKVLAKISSGVFYVVFCLFCLGCIGYWLRMPKVNDIARIEEVLHFLHNETKGNRFSFTLYGSRSFSDYHYRWYFLKNNIPVISLRKKSEKDLFVVCEKAVCPTLPELSEVASFTSMCDEKFCIGPYPEIRLTEYTILSKKQLQYSSVYHYQKR